MISHHLTAVDHLEYQFSHEDIAVFAQSSRTDKLIATGENGGPGQSHAK